MTEKMVNLVKIAVGITSIEELSLRQKDFLKKNAAKKLLYFYHTTRMMPRKHEDIVANGSLYWVIKGVIRARQKVIDIIKFEDTDGKKRCKILLEAKIIRTKPIRKRPFQGWRYLKKHKTPADLNDSINTNFESNIPIDVQKHLLDLGVI
tara:strand:+ start:1896 stop:2345 length:450 start_codon:yes stop_codon:yes gene_type:complete